jgi:hypothetical protein
VWGRARLCHFQCAQTRSGKSAEPVIGRSFDAGRPSCCGVLDETIEASPECRSSVVTAIAKRTLRPLPWRGKRHFAVMNTVGGNAGPWLSG